jgi:hypothetical protein
MTGDETPIHEEDALDRQVPRDASTLMFLLLRRLAR